jgi:hypothetical protein
MGAEASCVAHFGGQSSEGKAQLETDFLLFRGTFRVKIPLSGIHELSEAGGQLSLSFADGTLHLDLGAAAPKWLQKIKNPPSLLDKLGVKAGATVVSIGIHDERFLGLLRSSSVAVKKKAAPMSELIFAGIEAPADLEQVAHALPCLAPTGALWTVWPKGQKHITEAQVMAAGRAAGLVDTKIASFSATHTAMKWMIPVAKRPSGKA